MNNLTSNLIRIEKKATLNFPIDKIKESILKVMEVGRGSKYVVNDKNEMFGTFSIGCLDGLFCMIFDISLTEDGEKTIFNMVAYNASGSNATQGTVDQQATSFLKLLEMQLGGQDIQKEDIKKVTGSSGCMGIVLVLIALSVTVSILL